MVGPLSAGTGRLVIGFYYLHGAGLRFDRRLVVGREDLVLMTSIQITVVPRSTRARVFPSTAAPATGFGGERLLGDRGVEGDSFPPRPSGSAALRAHHSFLPFVIYRLSPRCHRDLPPPPPPLPMFFPPPFVHRHSEPTIWRR